MLRHNHTGKQLPSVGLSLLLSPRSEREHPATLHHVWPHPGFLLPLSVISGSDLHPMALWDIWCLYASLGRPAPGPSLRWSCVSCGALGWRSLWCTCGLPLSGVMWTEESWDGVLAGDASLGTSPPGYVSLLPAWVRGTGPYQCASLSHTTWIHIAA